jgi:chromosome segregation ATPase
MTKNVPRGGYDKSEAPMAQVREILFGAQLKDMEMRFRRQEERFIREINEVKESLRSRLDSLENFMKSEVNSIYIRLKEEQDERENSIKKEERERHEEVRAEARERESQSDNLKREFSENLAKENRERLDGDMRLNSDLQNTQENFERRASKISQNLETTERSIRELLMKEVGALSDKMDEKYNELVNLIAKTASQIRSDMVYRTALSTMFTDTVANLSKPWNLDVEDAEEGSEDIYESEEEHNKEPEHVGDSNQYGGEDNQGQDTGSGDNQGNQGGGDNWNG